MVACSSDPAAATGAVDSGSSADADDAASTCADPPAVAASDLTCKTATPNSCACLPVGTMKPGTVLVLAGITPKGEAVTSLRTAEGWSCPETLSGGPYVEVHVGVPAGMHDARPSTAPTDAPMVVARATDGSLFAARWLGHPFRLEPATKIPDAQTSLPFDVVAGAAVYARSSDSVIVRSSFSGTWTTKPLDSNPMTHKSFGVTWSGMFSYLADDDTIHTSGPYPITERVTPAAGAVAVFVGRSRTVLTGGADAITVVSHDGAGQVTGAQDCTPELCGPGGSGFARSHYPFENSVGALTWVRDGRVITADAQFFDVHDAKVGERALFANTTNEWAAPTGGSTPIIYARASDCAVRDLTGGKTVTIPRMVLSSAPSLDSAYFAE